MAAEESVTNYFSYVKNVLGVKTLQSARLRQSLQQATEEVPGGAADVLFLHLRQAQEVSVFEPAAADLLAKMIQAMRLGSRTHLVLECELAGKTQSIQQILQQYTEKVKTPFVVLFVAKPAKLGVQNLGSVKYLETYSPSHLLQNPNTKKVAWMDLQKVMKELGIS